MSFSHGETVTRVRAARVSDPYSGEVERLDWTSTTSAAIPGCGVAPRVSEEPLGEGRALVSTGLVVFAPTGADIGRLDRVIARGETWDVDGDPADWRNPFTGWAPGLAVNLKRIGG